MKVVHVHFFKKKGECQDFYFGSVAAMYEVFSAEDIGRAYNTITRRLGAKYYRTDNCYIRIGEIQTKKNAK